MQMVLKILLQLLNGAIGYEDGALGGGESGAYIEDNAGLLSVVGGQGIAENIGDAT